jgi:hypothetical protein
MNILKTTILGILFVLFSGSITRFLQLSRSALEPGGVSQLDAGAVVRQIQRDF